MKVHFLKLIKIVDGTADTLEKAILTYVEQANIPISSFGSDGAFVMVGTVNGVATRLKRLNKFLKIRYSTCSL